MPINVIIYSRSVNRLDRILSELRQKLDVPYEYDPYRRIIYLERGLLHPIHIAGRSGIYENLQGLRVDFYSTDDGRAAYFLADLASKVNGIRLSDIQDVLKIIDILKLSGVYCYGGTI